MTDCAECGFEYDPGLVPEVSTLTRVHAAEYAALLTTEDRILRQRTARGVWSPLEYACHVRDVLLAQRERVLLARRVDTPALEPMGRDERVEHDGYNEQRPTDVARQLDDAALLFANVLDRLARADWDRTVIYNFPQRQERPLRWLALHTLHELRHHLLDIHRRLDG